MSAAHGFCDQCGHEADQHSLFSIGASPLEGGIRLCPEMGCQCFSTWSVMGRDKSTIPMPSAQEIVEFRRMLQAGETVGDEDDS
jgi:hypothetical protein